MRSARTAEAAQAIGVASSTLQKWAQQDLVPFDTTAGGHRRFDVDEVRASLRRRQAPPDLDHLRRNRAQIRRIARRHGLDNIRVFGSVATATAHAGSDVDLLADAGPTSSLLDVMAAEIELEELLQAPVQITTTGGLDALEPVLADGVAL